MQSFGILNITEDSFSDGGRYLEPAAALAHAHALFAAGADVLDLGAASSAPTAQPVAPALEIARLKAVIDAFGTQSHRLSIDSFATEVQRWALTRKVGYLNDIQGFADPSFYPELAESQCRLIVMHSVQGKGPARPMFVPAAEIYDRVCRFFERRLSLLIAAGINADRLILDPGMGMFLGSDPEASFTMLRHIGALKTAFGRPVLISVSRKSFLRRLVNARPEEAGAASLAAELFALGSGADFLRTHDVAALRDGAKVFARLRGPLPESAI
ncbi:MAG: dihydropteroate synthase [Rhizomicrobium sp.]